ncbi:MAG: NUDIX domain-containing protein [Rubripirellula sp.]
MTSKPVEACFRYCPRCSTENPESGAVPFRCVECGYAQFFGPVAAVGGLVCNEAGQLLLVRRARNPGLGKWGLPGGFVDRNETIEEALAREVLEETNLHLAESSYLMSGPNHYDYCDMLSPVIDLFYVCRVEHPERIKLAEDELDHYIWTKPTSEHLDQMAFPSNRTAILHWLDVN